MRIDDPLFGGAPDPANLKPLKPTPQPLQRGLPLVGGADPPEKAAAVARDFEALLVKQIFASMRHTLAKGEGGFGEQMWTGMLDEQLAQQVAEGGGLGLVEPLAQVFGGAVDASPVAKESDHVD